MGNTSACIQSEIPFEIPKNWTWIRLNEVGIFKKGPFGSSLTKEMFVPEQTQNRVKVYEQKNAIQKDYKLGHYFISKQKFEEMKGFVVSPGDIIVSCAGTIGEIYVLPTEAETGIINQALMRICLYCKEIEEYFLLYFDSVLKKEANEKGNGTGMKNIPPFNVLKKMLIPIPPKAELNRIVSTIDLLSSKVNVIQKSFNSLNELSLRIKSKVLDAVFGENSSYKSYYAIREGELYTFCESITKGSTPTTYGFKYIKEGINFIKVENISDGKILDNINCHISEEAHDYQKRSQLKENDILYSIAGTIGKTCIVTKNVLPANTNQAFAIISGFSSNIMPEYLFYYLLWVSGKEGLESHGGGMNNATLGGLKKLFVWFPKKKEDQQTIVDKIKTAFMWLNVIRD